MSTSRNVLSADSLVELMFKSLPKERDAQNPALKDPYAAVGLFCHACMLAVGFRLVGLGEDHKLEAHSEPDNVRPLPQEWDASSTFAFRYAHSQSSMEYLIKVSRLGGKILVYGLGLGDDKTASFEITAKDFVSEGSLPVLPVMETSAMSTRLRNTFISDGRILDLSSLFKSNIIQKLAPGIRKEGYEESSQTPITQSRRGEEQQQPPPHDPLRDDRLPQPARPYPFDDPLAAAPRRPVPPGDFSPPDFENEYEIGRPPRGMRPGFGGGHPLNIGERDLYPPGLGPHDPLRIGPGGGFGQGGGGMHPTFDDPLFGGQGGGGGYNPQAPPGARYDPTGPGDGPPYGGLRGPRGPGFGGGGSGGNPFGGFGSGDFI